MHLANQHIYLKLLDVKDAVHMEGWLNNPEVIVPYCGRYIPTTVSQQEKWIDRVNNSKEEVRFGIYKKDDFIIGMVGLSKIDWYNRKACFGIMIGESRGHGYGKLATKMCVDYGFYYLGLQSIWAECQSDNIASSKSMFAAGFRFCGKWPQGCFRNGKYIDLHLYSLTRESWNDQFFGEEEHRLELCPRPSSSF